MDDLQKSFLQSVLKQRQAELWAAVISHFEIQPALQAQVQNWIRAGCIEEKAYAAAVKRRRS